MIGLRIQFSGELKYTLPCKGQVAGLPFGQGSQDLTEFAGGAASSLTYRENVADGDLPSQVKVIGLPIYHTGVEAGIEAPFDCYCCGEKVAREGLWPGALLLCKRVESCWPRGGLWLARFTSGRVYGTLTVLCCSTRRAVPDPQCFHNPPNPGINP